MNVKCFSKNVRPSFSRKCRPSRKKEILFDQKEEELRAKALRLREQESKLDLAAAAALVAAKKYDEFDE